jgi:diguanylate cyclase (GGDEF)-like protein
MTSTATVFRNDELAALMSGTPAAKASLVQIYPASASTTLVDLRGPRMTIGRDALCDIEVTDDFISRVHALLELNERGWRVIDRGSLNGTFVNDVKVTEQALFPGDKIRVGNHIYKFLSANDIEVQYHEAVYEMMTFDALTGTHNRRYFEESFRREVLRCIRHGRALALLVIDVDHFKQVNDRMGHLVGDEVLRALGAQLKRRTRCDEMVARYGGEEFMLVLTEAELADAVRVAEELRHGVCDAPVETSRGPVAVTISIGVAHYDGRSETTSQQLIDRADSKLYEAKGAGRNRVCW